jgi:hypothetical protein
VDTFPPIDPDAQKVLTFDCRGQLDPGEVLYGGITLIGVTLTGGGTDANPMGIIIGPPSYDASAQFILLPVGNIGSARLGNDYEFELESGTTFPINRIVARALLQVRVS